jgi:DNA polymerase sigma
MAESVDLDDDLKLILAEHASRSSKSAAVSTTPGRMDFLAASMTKPLSDAPVLGVILEPSNAFLSSVEKARNTLNSSTNASVSYDADISRLNATVDSLSDISSGDASDDDNPSSSSFQIDRKGRNADDHEDEFMDNDDEEDVFVSKNAPSSASAMAAGSRDDLDEHGKMTLGAAEEDEDDRKYDESTLVLVPYPVWFTSEFQHDWDLDIPYTTRLHNEIVAFTRFASLSPEELRLRELTILRLRTCIEKVWNEAIVLPFGSSATDLSLPLSDIDVSVFLPNAAAVSNKTGLNKIAKRLRTDAIAANMRVIAHARIPIIKYTDSRTGIDVDVCIDTPNGVQNSTQLADLLSQYPEAKPLVIIIKYLLRMRGLHEVFSGGLGSYSIVMMVLAHLQHVHANFTYHYDHKQKALNLGSLFLDFLSFYGSFLNLDEVGVAIANGGSYFERNRRYFGPNPGVLCVEDAFDSKNDVGAKSYRFDVVKDTFQYAWSILTNVRLYELLTRCHRERRITPNTATSDSKDGASIFASFSVSGCDLSATSSTFSTMPSNSTTAGVMNFAAGPGDDLEIDVIRASTLLGRILRIQPYEIIHRQFLIGVVYRREISDVAKFDALWKESERKHSLSRLSDPKRKVVRHRYQSGDSDPDYDQEDDYDDELDEDHDEFTPGKHTWRSEDEEIASGYDSEASIVLPDARAEPKSTTNRHARPLRDSIRDAPPVAQNRHVYLVDSDGAMQDILDRKQPQKGRHVYLVDSDEEQEEQPKSKQVSAPRGTKRAKPDMDEFLPTVISDSSLSEDDARVLEYFSKSSWQNQNDAQSKSSAAIAKSSASSKPLFASDTSESSNAQSDTDRSDEEAAKKRPTKAPESEKSFEDRLKKLDSRQRPDESMLEKSRKEAEQKDVIDSIPMFAPLPSEVVAKLPEKLKKKYRAAAFRHENLAALVAKSKAKPLNANQLRHIQEQSAMQRAALDWMRDYRP